MNQTRRLGPTLQSHVDLMRDLSGDLMVCESRNKANDTVRYPQRDRYEVRIAEWWQIREPIETSIKLFYKASFQHGVKHSAVNTSLKGFADTCGYLQVLCLESGKLSIKSETSSFFNYFEK
jgi:hypothetical protein